MLHEPVRIDGPAGALEGRWHPPAGEDARVAVVCHPHPQHGGTMDNKVVATIARALHLLGLGVLRFNFRGVGSSEGSYDEGMGEAEDLDAAVEYARSLGAGELWLAGFSFGAGISIRRAEAAGAATLISVAPPVPRIPEGYPVPRCRWLIVQGDEDELVDADEVETWVGALPVEPELVRLPGVEHFFHGKLTLLRETIVERLQGVREEGRS